MSRCCSKENSTYLSLKRKEGSWHYWAQDHLFAKLVKPGIIALLTSSCRLGLDYSWDSSLSGLYRHLYSLLQKKLELPSKPPHKEKEGCFLLCPMQTYLARDRPILEGLWRVRDIANTKERCLCKTIFHP